MIFGAVLAACWYLFGTCSDPFWDPFWEGFLMGFSWKIGVFWKAAAAIICYENNDFSVMSVAVSKTALGPARG